MWEWGLDGLAENAELLVSELVTNAVQTMAGQEKQAVVGLRLSSDNARLLIEVWDVDRGRQHRKTSELAASPTSKKREDAACSW